jgi:hypothetical protein
VRASALAVVVAAVALLAAGAQADGDPASDYLYTRQVFLPFDVKIPPDKQRAIEETLAGVNRGGYRIRVAVIASAYDLGAVPSLWLKPQTYARFLGEELAFVYKARLLIVMPNGFGLYWRGHSTDRESELLAKVPVTGGVGLVDTADAAVRKLAAAHGVTPKPVAVPKSTEGHDRLIIVVATCVVIAAAVGIRVLLTRRRRT